MHLMLHEYADGGRVVFELNDDGMRRLGVVDGREQVGAPVPGFIDTACESTEEGYDRLLEAVAWLTEEVRKRKQAQCVSTP